MNLFDMPYDKMFLLYENKEIKERVYFQKTRFDLKNTDHYFIKILKMAPKGNYLCQGYIYFYLDFLKRESNFIGLYVSPERRNEGMAQLLISYWITLCLDNGLYNLNTIWKQRKPFILYLLKKFKFDLLNIKEYETSCNTISICKNIINNDKCLFFKNSSQADTFKKGSIKAGDNYFILDKLTEDIQVLDQVLLSNLYMSKDDDAAYTKSLKLIDNFEKKIL